MLLPSDVARLVLGYLQEEGLSATSQAFIHESPNLKEYAEHTTGDGTIPACVFSIFGKGLTMILNEYVAAKAKESSHEVPAMMTSLWKKLDFTLNQIKSLQNSPSISACQRVRSRIGMANIARQRALTLAPTGGVVNSSVCETSSIISPAHTSNGMVGHSTPVCYTGPHPRQAAASGSINTPRDSPIQIVVSEHRLNPGPMSPGRRKWDTPRKRSGALSGTSGPGRSAATASSLSAEPQPEEVVDENFPQLVIQNARDKILGDRSLQEKLAENINKILANEPVPQTSKASSNTVEADQSIDEILGLQGEIHMSDDAIHDILEQTESDPAFQALFDLFDYNKTKFTDGETEDGDISSSPEESDTAGPSSTDGAFQGDDPGPTQTEMNATDAATSPTPKMRAGQERKTRKPAAPTLVKKVVIGSNGRTSRIENSSARLLVTLGDSRGVSSAAVDSNRKEKNSLLNDSAGVTPMDIDEPLNTPPPPLDSLEEPTTEDISSTKTAVAESASAASSRDSAVFAVPEEILVSNAGKKQAHKQAQGSKEQPAAASSSALSSQPVFVSPAQVQQNNTLMQTATIPQISPSNSKTPDPFSTSASICGTVTAASPLSAVGEPGLATARPGSPTNASTSATYTATSVSPTPASPASSCASAAATPDPSTTNPSTMNKAAADCSNIMSLKIIISDNQEEEPSVDTALTQAISSISSDKIPTIYLSSPAKSPGGPGTPKANLDEAAQAVTGLQNSEVHASPISIKAGTLITSPLPGTSQAQQNFIIQLPLDNSNSALQGATASYFLVTEPPTTDVQTRQVLLPAGVSNGQSLPTNQYGVTTPTPSQGYSTGPALILPSPVKPMMLPVSVVGQNTLGKVQMMSNQLVAIPNAVPVQQTETVKPKTPTVATKQPATTGADKNHAGRVVQPVSAENTGQQDAVKGSSHRRILCFDPSAEVEPQTAKPTTTTTPMAPNASTSQSVQQPDKNKHSAPPRTKPAILGGTRPKRRVETVRCSVDPQAEGGLVKEPNIFQQPQKEPVKKNSRKQDHSINKRESQSGNTSSVDASQPDAVKKSESANRIKASERKHNHDACDDEAKAKEGHSSRSLSSDSALKSVSKKDKEENSRKEHAEKVLKSREGRSEKRTPSQAMPNVTANKENEMNGSMKEQKQQSVPSSSASRDLSPPAVTQPISNTPSKTTKAQSKTSSLAKQATEMLHDIQGLNSPSTPVKRPGSSTSDLSLLGTSRTQEASVDCPRTPSQQKKGKDGEGTPKHLMPPNTPDVPTCSPASEAGSESSINMAAHTLMILSRAAIARTGTPLKDSLRQEEVREKSLASSKNSKKRKQSSPIASPAAKKEAKRSPTKKKERERKKLIDCFPHDLDVDKFLSSLHYDE